MKIEFTKEAIVNRATFKKGDTLNVSTSIYNRLINEGAAKLFKEKKPEKPKAKKVEE